MKEKIKKYIPEIISIIIPIIIICIACLFTNTKPFGEYLLAKYDGLSQYASFTINFKNVLLGKNSLFYSFGGSLGYNFYATSIYYMFNPTNILCLFATKNTITEYYTFLIFLRISLSAFTMCKYLKYKFKNQNNIFYISFSVCYALMGYNVCYFFNYMYFDNVMFFPILMIGLEKLINERKNILYIIMLTISILSNFYIGYMECIFCLIYFIYNYINLKKKDKKIIKDFIISSLLSGFMCMITLIPEILELMQGKLEHFSDEFQTDYFKFNHNYLNFFYKLTPGSMVEYDIKYGTINIYVSLLVGILVMKYFFLKNISKKEKITTLIFILFFLLSTSFNLIDYGWQMFQKPIWYPNRYIFTFSFFLIMIAAKTYANKEKINQSIKCKIIISIVYILLITLAVIINKTFTYMYGSIKIAAFILSTILLIEYMFLFENKNALMLIISMLFIELLFNTIVTFKEQETIYPYNNFQKSTQEKTNITNYIEKIDEKKNNFYRINLEKTNIHTEGSFYEYNGVNSFSSIKNSKLLHFFKDQMHYDVLNKTSLIFNYYNPYITSIIGVKYIDGTNEEYYYEKIYDKYPATTIYKNNDSLSLGFMINKNISNYKYTNNSYENTKNLTNKMTNMNNKVYESLNKNIKLYNSEIKKIDDKEYVIVNNKDDNYISIEGTITKDGFVTSNKKKDFYVLTEVYINNKKLVSYGRNKIPLILKKGDKYKVIFKSTKDKYEYKYIKWYLMYLNDYKDFINELKKNELQIIEYKKDDYIKGTINVTNDKTTLFTSIPYNKGWKVIIDGKENNYKDCANAFICVDDLSEGTHTIEFKFVPQGFIVGCIISITTLFLTIIYINKGRNY